MAVLCCGLRRMSDHMKIAYIIPIFPSLSETFILNEMLELRRRGFEIEIFSIDKPESHVPHYGVGPLVERTHYLLDRLNSYKNMRRLLLFFYFSLTSPSGILRALSFSALHGGKGLRKAILWAGEIREMGADRIHAHFAGLPTEIAMIASFLTGIPYSFTAHAKDLFVRPNAMKEKLENAKAVIMHCEFNRKYVLENWPVISGEKIENIHCSIDCRHFSREKEYTKGGRFILSVGRLVKKKGFRYLIEACARLKKSGKSFTCKIVGTGPEENFLKEIIEKEELQPEVSLLGARSGVEVKELLEEATVFVLPCVETDDGDRDSLPTVIKEAMAMEVPVVTTESGSIGELVKNGAGVCVPPRDPDSLAEAVESLFNLEEGKLREMGRVGKQVIEEDFSIQSQSGKLQRFFADRTS